MKKKKIAAILSLTLAFSTASTAFAAWSLPKRVYGSNRYKTSVAVSNVTFEKAENVVISSGENYPDALSAVPLATKLNAPILLTSKGSISSEVKDEIKKLGAKNVYIIGGKMAVSDAVEKELKTLGLNIKRIFGTSRYNTAFELSKNMGSFDKVVLTVGTSYQEALSISSIAAKLNMPIVLTDGNTIAQDTLKVLNGSNVKKVYVIGGEKDIPSSLLKNVKNVERVGRGNKDLVDVDVLNYFRQDISLDNIIIARGETNLKDSFADALSGGVLGGKYGAGILLINKDLNAEETNFIGKLNKGAKVLALGGEYALSETIYGKVEGLLPKEGTVTPPAGGGGSTGGNELQDAQYKKDLLNRVKACMPYVKSSLTTDKQRTAANIIDGVMGSLLQDLNYDFSSEKAQLTSIKSSMETKEYDDLKRAIQENIPSFDLSELDRLFGLT